MSFNWESCFWVFAWVVSFVVQQVLVSLLMVVVVVDGPARGEEVVGDPS